ncbi:MAG: SPOR domain-containing protein [Myxococcota bacterium]
MRDAHRLKEKFDLSLDNRQIVSLAIAGLVVLGAVFVLGVVVGKKLAVDQGASAAPDLLSALDAKAASTPLTFQEELTKKTPDAATSEPIAAAVASPLALPEPAPKEPEPAEPVEVAAPKPDAVVPTRTKDGGLKEALARASRPTETVPDGAFTLQLSASQDRAEAERFVAKLRDRGYAPFIVQAEVPGRGTWYRVRMGSFGTKEAATRYLQDFRRETNLDAFVASN